MPGQTTPKVTVTRVAVARSRELTAAGVQRVRAAARADGAAETGLAQLLWVNALHLAGDAMIAVALAGTLFFAAPTHAQRGNVALYLLVTMAPFALLAPVIGPALDRLQRGRRWALAASLLGRGGLALVMAQHVDDFALYPAALGALVLSKAFGVLKAAVVPRVLPPALPLTSANSRLSIFGLVTVGVFGGVGGALAHLLGFRIELSATAFTFGVAAVLALRLPRHVDVAAGERPAAVLTSGPVALSRRGRPVHPRVTTALGSNAALRGLGGFFTVFTAFLVQARVPGGWPATLWLGAIVAAGGAGSVLGTALGSRLRGVGPDRLVLLSAVLATAVTVAAAVVPDLPVVALAAGVSGMSGSLAKVALDAIIQTEVPDGQRASAFARSETWLQLAWVLGGGLGIALPPTGRLGFAVVAVVLVLALAAVLAGGRRRRPAGAVLLLLLASACGRSAAPPPEVQVSVATEQVRLKPTQYCQDGQLHTYDTQPPVIAAPPATRITLTVPAAVAERGWSVQVFDDQLKQQLAEVPVAAGQAVLDQITTSDPAPPGFYLVVVEKKTASCSSLAGAWPVGFLRSGG